MYPKIANCGKTTAFGKVIPATYKFGVQWDIAGQSGAKGVTGRLLLNRNSDPFEMKAGKSGSLGLELFGVVNTMKDFSVVAFGEKGPVSIIHQKGLTSATWFNSGV